MTFISYAQNFEDVMLWRALKHIENGFYIDVGANDTSSDSVTRAFYERGWHGINIEPLLSHYAVLKESRIRDINLQCAAGAEEGELDIWECDVRGWATLDPEVAKQHERNGHIGTWHKVLVRLLSNICAQHINNDIHFLKIDVEGFEKSVIAGADFSRFRPWILVIEATRPNSTEEVYDEWEIDILLAGYVFGYADGLNRFYVANEHGELLKAFRYPPNVFDRFIRSEQLNSEIKAQQAEIKAQQAEAKLKAVYASSSWRLTRPMREVGLTISSLKNKSDELTMVIKKWIFILFLKPLIKLIYTPLIILRVKKWSIKHPKIHMMFIQLINGIVQRVNKNDITAHDLMQLVKLKLANKEQLGNVLYIKDLEKNE